MIPQYSNGITAKKLEAVKSSDVSQTNAQTSDCDYDPLSSTAPGKGRKDWLDKGLYNSEASMRENHIEGTGYIGLGGDIQADQSESLDSTSHSSGNDSALRNRSAIGMQVPICLDLPEEMIEALISAMRNAPVNVSTTGELNLNWMMHYVNLRCDINFDHDIHFTPIKGSRGEEKRKQALMYWLALKGELSIYHHKTQNCQQCGRSSRQDMVVFEPRLPAMFQDLKDLLETLVPDKDHDQVAANLDIDLITQQVENGVLDVGRLSRWLAKLLKTHCAPMRDESAEVMAEKLETGANNGDLSMLINGLDGLFRFLEAMKLDVANHQIRTFRYILIDETIAFQQSHFRKRIDDGRLNLDNAKSWYRDLYDQRFPRDCPDFKSQEAFCFETLIIGLIQLCGFSPEAQSIPNTLHYDQARINQLRADVQDLVILRLCVKVFDKLLVALRCRNPVLAPAYSILQSRLLMIAEDETAPSGFVAWGDKLEEIAIEITRAAYVASSFPESPRIPEEAFDRTKDLLRVEFRDEYSAVEEQLLFKLTEETMQHAAKFQRMSTLAMSEAQKQYQQNRPSIAELFSPPEPESMARMLAHMGVLHWQVWRDLAYMEDVDDTVSLSSSPSSVEEGEEERNGAFVGSSPRAKDVKKLGQHGNGIDNGEYPPKRG